MDARLNLVHIVLRLSNCRSLDEIVEVLRESTRGVIGADGITIVLRDHDKCYYAEENAIGPLWKGKRFPMSACISGWCMIHRQQVVISDIYQDERIPHDAYRPTFVKSLAMTPIRVADPVGAIGAYWATHHSATREELAALQALGNSAAMALQNAQLIEQLTESNRRKDIFISMLSHELRSPLAPLANSVQLLRMQSAGPETVAQTSEVMERQIGHLARIVEDLLDVTRINNGKVALRKTRIDLARVLRHCAGDHHHEFATAGVRVTLKLPDHHVWINADATRLTQVFNNMLDNARKYTCRDGSLEIDLNVDKNSGEARIEFRDTGVGIPPTLLTRIFEAFMQADTSLERTNSGLGLGLTVASGYVKLHGGSITAHSDGIGHGSLFTITLPEAEIAEAQAAPEAIAPPKIEKLRLLIIEDNQDSAMSLQKLMKACGFDVTIAYDGQSGLEMAQLQRPDVVLSDLGLPKLDGFGIAAALRQSSDTAGIKLIAMSGYGSQDDRQRSREAGFDAHLTKPINFQELMRHVAQGETAAAQAAR